jgi:hypothetical protein
MTSNIKSTIFLIFGIFVIVAGFSSTSFGQNACVTITLPNGSEFTADPGTKIESFKFIDGKMVVKVCSEDTKVQLSTPSRTQVNECAPPPQQTPTAEEIQQERKRQLEEQKQEQLANKRLSKDPGDTARDRKPQ